MTRKQFREFLNKRFPVSQGKHKHGRYGNRSRGYGDYLWYSDRDQFEFDYATYLESPSEYLNNI